MQALKSFGECCTVDIEDDLVSMGYDCAKNDNGVSCYNLAIHSNDVMHNVYRNCWDRVQPALKHATGNNDVLGHTWLLCELLSG